MKLIVLGAPGAGKGTQSEIISDRYHIPILGTGNLIREVSKSDTPLGKEVTEYMNQGKLVPDQIVITLLKERMKQPDTENGYILDGFPRNVAQAEALDEMGVAVDRVIEIDVDDATIINRISGRRVCGKCGSSYHIEFKKPKVDGICDKDGEALVVRPDDSKIVARLEEYHEQTEPLKEYYQKMGKLYSVKGLGNIEDITEKILAALEA